MNNARIWTIVNPSVGVPIFFIGVMVTSLFIHFQVLTTTTWFGEFWAGSSGDVAVQVDSD
ncbi:MAG: light-harvesting protein [Myxococcota bacterium]